MDRAFFEQLAMPLFDQLYNHAHWLTGDRVDAEDAHAQGPSQGSMTNRHPLRFSGPPAQVRGG